MAAEVAAGVWAAEEVVSTTAQVGFAAYMVSQPSNALIATFTHIASAPDEGTRASLARSNHSVTIVGSKAYIFGGEVDNGKLATTEVHAVSLLPNKDAEEKGEHQYALFPALAAGETGGEASGEHDEISDGVPTARSRHAACGFNVCVAVFSGSDTEGNTIDEKGRIWLFNTAKSTWEFLGPKVGEQNVPSPRTEGKLFEHDNDLILYGGFRAAKEPLTDTWHFSYVDKTWTRLADSPEAGTNVSLADGTLYLLTSSNADNGLSGSIHSLVISSLKEATQPATWTTQTFPTNPLTPAPKPRVSGGTLPITTGHGRHFLLLFFGAKPNHRIPLTSTESETSPEEPTQYPDLWTLQLPSNPRKRSTSTITTGAVLEALRPAALKDTIRSAFKADPGTNGWAEVDVVPPELDAVPDGEAGKVHPGPRAWFGSDVIKSDVGEKGDGGAAGRTVVLWGGVSAGGEREGDGWVIKLQ